MRLQIWGSWGKSLLLRFRGNKNSPLPKKTKKESRRMGGVPRRGNCDYRGKGKKNTKGALEKKKEGGIMGRAATGRAGCKGTSVTELEKVKLRAKGGIYARLPGKKKGRALQEKKGAVFWRRST